MAIIRQTTEELIAKCKEIVEREQEFATLDSEYMNDTDPSVLRFLLASRVEVSEQQLRDDLLSMLVAGHETTGSVLTWTLKLLVENPEAMRKATEEARSRDRFRDRPLRPLRLPCLSAREARHCVWPLMRVCVLLFPPFRAGGPRHWGQ